MRQQYNRKILRAEQKERGSWKEPWGKHKPETALEFRNGPIASINRNKGDAHVSFMKL